MNRHCVRSRQRLAGFSSVATIWFLVLAVTGGAFVCSSYFSSNDGSPKAIGEAGSPASSASSGPPTSYTKHIEDIKAGDRVWAYDTSAHTWAAKMVLKPLVHDYDGDLVTISVGDRRIQCTGNHPFWVISGTGLFDRPQAQDVYPEDRASAIALGNGRWIEARRLEAGDSLVLRDGSLAPIDEVQITATHQKVYNLQVADLHTYGVTDLGIAVHNKCFVAGTRVLMGASNSTRASATSDSAVKLGDSKSYLTKKIEDIRIGDYVLAKDPNDRGPPTPHRVIALPRNWTEHIVHVHLKDVGEIEATRNHPFYVDERGWVCASDLKIGDSLLNPHDQPVVVDGIWTENRDADTYNLTVDGVHTYYVVAGQAPVLVHNADELPPNEPFVAPEGYSPSPFISTDPFSPENVARRQSDLRRQLGTGNNDPDSEIPDQPGAGSNIKGSHSAKGGTPHDTGERNVNPNEEHSRVAKGRGGNPCGP